MPIYEYKCSQCNSKFEVFQAFFEPPIRTCKKCGGKVHKLVSQSSFHLKGSGWYVTDYARKPGSANKPSKGVKPSNSSSSTDKKSPKSPTDSSNKSES